MLGSSRRTWAVETLFSIVSYKFLSSLPELFDWLASGEAPLSCTAAVVASESSSSRHKAMLFISSPNIPAFWKGVIFTHHTGRGQEVFCLLPETHVRTGGWGWGTHMNLTCDSSSPEYYCPPAGINAIAARLVTAPWHVNKGRKDSAGLRIHI